MDPTGIIIIVSALLSVLCGGATCIFIALMILGFVLLRRRGKKKVTAQEAVKAGVESVSQVFVRGQGGLSPMDDDDDDD